MPKPDVNMVIVKRDHKGEKNQYFGEISVLCFPNTVNVANYYYYYYYYFARSETFKCTIRGQSYFYFNQRYKIVTMDKKKILQQMKIKNKNRKINEDTIEIQNLFRYKKTVQVSCYKC